MTEGKNFFVIKRCKRKKIIKPVFHQLFTQLIKLYIVTIKHTKSLTSYDLQ